MRVWFDVDGVLADFTSAYLQVAQRVTGRTIGYGEVKTFEFAQSVVSEEENVEIWDIIHSTPGLVRALSIHWPWFALVKKLRLDGHHVGALTSPAIGPYWIPERVAWLETLGFAKRDIVFASNKGHVQGDVLIDDKPENCTEWLERNPRGCTFLVNRPWNAHAEQIRYSDPDTVYRVLRTRLAQAR